MAYITKELFVGYEVIRRSGKFNMFMDAEIVERMLGCKHETYMYMIREYSNLYAQYIEN